MPLRITSPAFEHGAPMPRRYSCEGDDVSPALGWSGVPGGTKSLALIVDDPDAPDPVAPKHAWVHWVLYDIPPDVTRLREGIGGADLPRGTREGLNDWKKADYGGPCPPVGRHRYFFKLYALDCMLSDMEHPTKAELERAMDGHVLARAKLVGTFKKGHE